MMWKREISRPWLFVAMLTFSLAACAERTAPFSGVVLEKGTEQPIADATVVALWEGSINRLVDSASVCVHAMTTTTNAKGEYSFPAWKMEKSGAVELDRFPTTIAYKKGYTTPGPGTRHPRGIFYLVPFHGSIRERLIDLRGFAVSCIEAGASKANLYPYVKMLYEDAKEIAQTTDDQKIVNWLRERAASYALAGSETERADTIEGIKNRQKMIEKFMEENLP